jgi:hypothetical protein
LLFPRKVKNMRRNLFIAYFLNFLISTTALAGAEIGNDSGVRPGQADMDNSLPVTMASNQAPISITGTVLANNGSVGFTSAAVPNQSTFAGGEDPSGNLEGLKVDSLRSLIVNGSNYTQPISAVSLPLPTGAATEAKQDVGNASAASIDSKITTTVDGIKVDGSAVIQPISGSVSATQGTSPWVTSRNWNLSDSTDFVTAVQGTSPWLTSRDWTLSSGTDSVAIAGTVAVTQSTSPWVIDGSGFTQPISVASLPLPTGAATAARQDTGNASVASIDSKITTTVNGIKVDGSAVTQPVSGTVTANQGTSPWVTSRTWTLSNGTDSIAAVQSGTWSVRVQDGAGNALASSTTTPAGTEQALIVRNIPSGTQTVSGTVAVTQSTNPWVTSRNWTLSSGGDSVASVQSGTWTVQPGNTANTTPWLTTINQGGNSVSVTGSNALKVDGSAVTQPISAASLPLPSGAATATKQDTGNTSLASIDTKITTTANGVKVDGSAVTQPVSGTVTVNQGTSPWVVDTTGASGAAMINRTDVASTTVSTSGNSAAFDTAGLAALNVSFNLTAISGVGAYVQFHVQTSDDNSTWTTYADTARLTTTQIVRYQSFRQAGRYYRFSWDVAGTTPSVTFNVITTIKQFQENRKSIRFFYSDIDLAINGNASSVFSSDDCRNVSVVWNRAAGGTNASVQVFASNDQSNWFSQTSSISANPAIINGTSFSAQSFRFYELQVATHAGAGATMDITWSCN